jgi:3-dehydroquinate dehydratase-1
MAIVIGGFFMEGCINPRIALVISDQETNVQIKKLDVALIELRADLFKSQDPAYVVDQIKQRRALKTPLLLTVRNQKNEGAVKVFPDKKKLDIITAALPFVDMVDIELSSPLLKQVIKICHSRMLLSGIHKSIKVIVSSHYLKNTPKDLEAIFKKSLKTGADIVKIAGRANSFDDVTAMIDFTRRHRKHKIITMSLGPIGSISRLILPATGSLYTYTFLHKPKAEGQIDITTLKSHLKFYSFSR